MKESTVDHVFATKFALGTSTAYDLQTNSNALDQCKLYDGNVDDIIANQDLGELLV